MCGSDLSSGTGPTRGSVGPWHGPSGGSSPSSHPVCASCLLPRPAGPVVVLGSGPRSPGLPLPWGPPASHPRDTRCPGRRPGSSSGATPQPPPPTSPPTVSSVRVSSRHGPSTPAASVATGGRGSAGGAAPLLRTRPRARPRRLWLGAGVPVGVSASFPASLRPGPRQFLFL